MSGRECETMPKIKICGIKTLADVEKVNQYLPEYIGFVFANTKRFVTDRQAYEMKQALAKTIQAVGVFVDEPIDHVINLCKQGILDVVQLHGAESEAYIRALKEKTDTIVIKAVRVQTAEQALSLMSEETDFMLFDTYKKGEFGGTGARFSLETLAEIFQNMKAQKKMIKPYFLAGGLNHQNVAKVITKMTESVGCYAVDVSTGVETDGIKDDEKIRQFIQNVRRFITD